MLPIITIARTEKDFQGILKLQEINHKDSVSDELKNREGFVTVKHDLDLLQEMANLDPQIIAKFDDQVIGFALVMSTKLKDSIDVLKPMFTELESVEFQNKAINNLSYYIMGQICIAEKWRKKGLFTALYNEHRNRLFPKYQLCITEVSEKNPRSLRAHLRYGFDSIHQYSDVSDDWHILAYDLTQTNTSDQFVEK